MLFSAGLSLVQSLPPERSRGATAALPLGDASLRLPIDNAGVHLEFVEPDSDTVIGSIEADASFDGTDVVIRGARSAILANVLGPAFRDRWFDVVTDEGRFRNYRAVTDGSTTLRLCHFGP